MSCHPKAFERAYQCRRIGWFPQEGEEIHGTVSFEEVWNNFCLTQLFKNTKESMEEIKALFDKAWSALLMVKKLKKLEDPRKFVVLYIILGVEFLCDIGSTVSHVRGHFWEIRSCYRSCKDNNDLCKFLHQISIWYCQQSRNGNWKLHYSCLLSGFGDG